MHVVYGNFVCVRMYFSNIFCCEILMMPSKGLHVKGHSLPQHAVESACVPMYVGQWHNCCISLRSWTCIGVPASTIYIIVIIINY